MVPGSKRPLVAISSCLLGENVRYDGRHKRDPCIAQYLSTHVDWKPVCPEVGAGLGVPRPAIQLVGTEERPAALGVENSSLEVTEALLEYAQRMLPELRDVNGYVFKSRSPSCGLVDTPLFDSSGQELAQTAGLFARVIVAALPALPVIDEQQLHDTQRRARFLQQVQACWQQQKSAGS
ncbi:MAG TPA: DUF523 domain-containing protein [Gammaproteobacteria bacterium]|nr:DUF523 domain-containing protein [Gammaproteobacteria bacterium]